MLEYLLMNERYHRIPNDDIKSYLSRKSEGHRRYRQAQRNFTNYWANLEKPVSATQFPLGIEVDNPFRRPETSGEKALFEQLHKRFKNNPRVIDSLTNYGLDSFALAVPGGIDPKTFTRTFNILRRIGIEFKTIEDLADLEMEAVLKANDSGLSVSRLGSQMLADLGDMIENARRIIEERKID